jgi:hypothetical protein
MDAFGVQFLLVFNSPPWADALAAAAPGRVRVRTEVGALRLYEIVPASGLSSSPRTGET